jgi:hypothetical protein
MVSALIVPWSSSLCSPIKTAILPGVVGNAAMWAASAALIRSRVGRSMIAGGMGGMGGGASNRDVPLSSITAAAQLLPFCVTSAVCQGLLAPAAQLQGAQAAEKADKMPGALQLPMIKARLIRYSVISLPNEGHDAGESATTSQ